MLQELSSVLPAKCWLCPWLWDRSISPVMGHRQWEAVFSGQEEVRILGLRERQGATWPWSLLCRRSPLRPREFSELEGFKQKPQSEFCTHPRPLRKAYLI